MPSPTYLALVTAYAGNQNHTLSLRMRNLIAAIAQLIDEIPSGGGGVANHFVAQVVAGTENNILVTTGQALTELPEFGLLTFKPDFNNTAAAFVDVDGVGAIEILSPEGVSLAADSLLSTRYYTGIFSGAPVSDLILTEF